MTFFESLCENIQEYLLKLGFSDSDISLNYPQRTLAALLGDRTMGEEELSAALTRFCRSHESELGTITVRHSGSLYIVTVGSRGIRYIRENVPPNPLTAALILLCGQPGTDEEGIASVFREIWGITESVYGNGDDFDVCFFRGDSPRYCFKFEFGTASYHRLAKEDFEALYGESDRDSL